MSLVPLHRGFSAKSSHSTAPAPQTSTPTSYRLAPNSNSGARYHLVATWWDMSPAVGSQEGTPTVSAWGEATSSPGSVISEASGTGRARPKSAILRTPLGEMRQLAGLMSRCRMPLSCIWANPWRSIRTKDLTFVSNSGLLARSIRTSRSDGAKSNTSMISEFEGKASTRLTMFGCPESRRRAASSRKTGLGRLGSAVLCERCP
mmetsp:Transcript_25833/g.51881  ORF Transcript_25833/g.51881 Transcript_25833/m.51881 type:complete len:204 (-) Transcript_25833:341-952(-)